MPFKKGDPNINKGGRPKGIPNRSTEELKQTLVNIANNTLDKVEADLEKIRKKNPARAIELSFKLLEYVAPKLKSIDVSGHMEIENRIEKITVNINKDGTKNRDNRNVSEHNRK